MSGTWDSIGGRPIRENLLAAAAPSSDTTGAAPMCTCGHGADDHSGHYHGEEGFTAWACYAENARGEYCGCDQFCAAAPVAGTPTGGGALFTATVEMWECSGCGFCYDAQHSDSQTGEHSCPVCEIASLESRLVKSEQGKSFWQQATDEALAREWKLKDEATDLRSRLASVKRDNAGLRERNAKQRDGTDMTIREAIDAARVSSESKTP